MRRGAILGIAALAIASLVAIGAVASMLGTRKSAGAEAQAGSSAVQVVHDEEYPPDDPDCRGTLLSDEDGLLTLGSGDAAVVAKIDSSTGKRTISVEHSGPTVQVRMSASTTVYEDVTAYPDPALLPKDRVTVVEQRIERVDRLDASRDLMELLVWGTDYGGITEASIIVYRLIGPPPQD